MSSDSDHSATPRTILTIGAHNPFLPTLAAALVEGRLVDGYCPANDPMLLPKATLYLPTRRAARAMGLALLNAMEQASGKRAILLPRIRTLGDLDDEESLDDIAGAPEDLALFMLDSAKVMETGERKLLLAQLVRRWMDTLQPRERALFENEHVVLPSSAADALRLAGDLADFMDQVETEEVPWEILDTIVPSDHADWWALTARFLTILMEAWPRLLMEEGRINPATFRAKIADLRIARIQARTPQSGPVIAVGSTGSIPATSRLLGAIARSSNCAVVLPGLDREMPEAVFQALCDERELTGNGAASTHPQFSMARLLNSMKLKPGDVPEIAGAGSGVPAERITALHAALLPAGETALWQSLRKNQGTDKLKDAFENCALVEARNERHEALAIALILRETLQTPGRTAALVTPDRSMAKRVSAELERFGVGIDDSAGIPLMDGEACRSLRHFLQIAQRPDVPADPVSWAAFFKGPIASALLPEGASRLPHLMELAVIRDCIALPTLKTLVGNVAAARKRVDATPHAHPLLKEMPEAGWLALTDWAEALTRSTQALSDLAGFDGEITVSQMCGAILKSLGDAGATEALFSLGGGESLHRLLTRFHTEAEHTCGFSFPAGEIVPVFDVLVAGTVIRDGGRTHPRLQILGTLEARLQDFDRVVLAGLNEGNWPPTARNDPFLNRPMRSQVGLPLPERRIGLAAHDFVQLSGHKEVFYTRSKRSNNAPAIACRWLQRLETFAGKEVTCDLRERGDRYCVLADRVDAPSGDPLRAQRAEARPPVEHRPRKLSITEIETWIRDPYAIHARHVLGLRPYPPLVRDADPALRGTLYHAIVARFVQTWQGPITETAFAHLDAITQTEFEAAGLNPEIAALWRPRFRDVAADFLDWETQWRGRARQSHCEVSGRMEVDDSGFTLSGRADRIDILSDGSIAISDYKTGAISSGRIARTLDPQLALAGAMARDGAFADVPAAGIGALQYVELKSGKPVRAHDITFDRSKKVMSEDELADLMMHRLRERIREYQSPDQGYVSRYAPKSETRLNGDYDHLARVREWSIDAGSEEEGGGE